MSPDDGLEALRALGRLYGGDRLLVQAGGGNSSVKLEGERMWVKASGSRMADVDGRDAFVEVDLAQTRAILEDEAVEALPPETRETEVKDRLMAARARAVEARPSIETFLHALLPWRFVVHSHPVYVNALACASEGRELARRCFGPDRVLWVPYARPGYALGRVLRSALRAHRAENGTEPATLVLANHGLIVGGDDPAVIAEQHGRLFAILQRHFGAVDPVRSDPWPGAGECAGAFRDALRDIAGTPAEVAVAADPRIASLATDTRLLSRVGHGALFPDYVVYLGRLPLMLSPGDDRRTVFRRTRAFVEAEKVTPAFAVVAGAGVLVAGRHERERAYRCEMLAAQAHVLTLLLPRAEPVFLDDDSCRELMDWEWERYRSGRV